MKAISVCQPWAWLLFHGKCIENRDWYTAYRGPLVIMASKGMSRAEYEDAVSFVRHWNPALADRIPSPYRLVYGAALGRVMQTGCVREHPSWWFQGKWGHVYEDPELFPQPIPARGQLNIFDWEPPADALVSSAAKEPTLFGEMQ